MSCLFCNHLEPNYKSDPQVEFICGGCVILLTGGDQTDLKNAYKKAVNEGYKRKVSALESFIIPEGKDEQRKPESKKCGRYSNRRGIAKSDRIKKERIERIEI